MSEQSTTTAIDDAQDISNAEAKTIINVIKIMRKLFNSYMAKVPITRHNILSMTTSRVKMCAAFTVTETRCN